MAKELQGGKSTTRAWQRMLSGRRLDLLDPSPMDIEIEDIAHGLARVARWNGQTTGDHAFSVAQHSLVVEEICGHIQPDLSPRWRLAALLHDGEIATKKGPLFHPAVLAGVMGAKKTSASPGQWAGK